MLDYTILSKKDNISMIKDGKKVVYKDLLSSSISKDLSNGNGGKYIIVNEYYIARPDLISLAVYGDDKYGDMICKANGISNPFELNKGMFIYIPSMGEITEILSSMKNNGSDILAKYNSKSSLNKDVYTNTKEKIKLKKSETIDKKVSVHQKYKNEKRSPGEQTVIDKNYYIDYTHNLVIY